MIQADSDAPHFTLGCTLATTAMQARSLTIDAVAHEIGVSRPTLSYIFSGKRPITPRIQRALVDALGVPAAAWTTSADATLPTTAETDANETALEGARVNLAAIRTQLARPDLVDSARVAYLRAESAGLRLLGGLTGELADSDAARFRSSPEYRSTVRRIVGAISGCQRCSDNVVAVLGAHDSTLASARIDCQVPLVAEELATFCDRVERHATVDDLAAATDILHYRTHQRERELVNLDLRLARRVHAALELAQPIIQASKIAYGPADDHRQRVIDTLNAEITRGDRLGEFRKRHGDIAAREAMELFGEVSQ